MPQGALSPLQPRFNAALSPPSGTSSDKQGNFRVVYFLLYLTVRFALSVSSRSVSVTFTFAFVVMPFIDHSNSSVPFNLYVPWTVCPRMRIVAVPSLLNSAAIFVGAFSTSHLPRMRL